MRLFLLILFCVSSQVQASRAISIEEFEVEGVDEVSGAAFDEARGLLWTIPDSGNDAYLGRSDITAQTTEIISVKGAENEDWEAIVQGPDGNLWILDVGDNDEERSSVQFYRIDPRKVSKSARGKLSVSVKQTIDVTLPEAMNIEAGIFLNKRIYLFQKTEAVGKAKVVSVAINSQTESETAVLEGTLPKMNRITDASLSPSGELYLLATHQVYHCQNCIDFSAGRPAIQSMRNVGPRKAESLVALDDSNFLVGDETGYFSITD